MWNQSVTRSFSKIALPLVVLAMMSFLVIGGLAATLAMYDRIIVVEPSQKVPSLTQVVSHARFPIWISTVGNLSRVSELGHDTDYTVILDYMLDDGRRFSIIETYNNPYHTDNPRNVIDNNIDINGNIAVLYIGASISTNGSPKWDFPTLHWHAEGTAIYLSPSFHSKFQRDELVTIARSMVKTDK